MSSLVDDLAAFAALELASGDLEPWAELIGELVRAGAVDDEAGLWLTKLYNAYDDLGSAWHVADRWPSPDAWYLAADRHEAADYPCTQERRNLRGGRVLRHLESYAAAKALGAPQRRWLTSALGYPDPDVAYRATTLLLRTVWGTGRQSAFEWAEFLTKAHGFPLHAPDAMLWESEGPRRSLQSIYGNPKPTAAWLNERASELRTELAERGVVLSWEDFETVICDFHVMRAGRYYPGRHLAALREELDSIPASMRGPLDAAWEVVVPMPWAGIAPGIDKAKLPVYRDSGVMVTSC